MPHPIIVGASLVGGPIGFVAVPRAVLTWVTGTAPHRAPALPWLAAVVFNVAWWLPSPMLEGSTSFSQHTAGGVACALLGMYLAVHLGLAPWVVRVALCFAVASTLGVCVEVVEWTADKLDLNSLSNDNNLDLVANTLGALTAALLLELVLQPTRRWHLPGLRPARAATGLAVQDA